MMGNVLNKSILAAVFLGMSISTAFADEAPGELPDFYDLRLAVPEDRSSGYDPRRASINPIRNQGFFGTCWAFSAIASVESDVYLQMKRAGLPYHVTEKGVDLSEWYLAWVSAAPPIGVTEDTVPHSKGVNNSVFYRPFAQKVYGSGFPAFELETMMANGTGLDWERGTGIRNIIAPSEYKKPVLQLRNIYFRKYDRKSRDSIKEMLMKYGAVSIALNANALVKDPFETSFYHHKRSRANHAVNIVGWDDGFDFSGRGLPVLPEEKGAWLIRNSWGTDWGELGYAHVSYEDKTLSLPVAFDVDTDAGSVSYVKSHEANNELSTGDFGDYLAPKVPRDSAFAAGFTSEGDVFLRRVGFYAMRDRMSYTLEVRLGSKDPAAGRLVYRESGEFGEDGSPGWSGYRIVPLKQAVFLPRGEAYSVTVGLTAPQGQDTNYLLAPSEVEDPSVVASFIRMGEKGPWQRIMQKAGKGDELPIEFYLGSVIERCYLKNSREPMGCDFTVAHLDNGGKFSGAVIDLGRRGEPYGQDLLHPRRETLSEMKLALEEDCDFGGIIMGEGGIVKRGDGILILRGENMYSGGTVIEEGALILAPPSEGASASLFGDVTLRGGWFGGQGEVQGSLQGEGVLALEAAGILRLQGTADLRQIALEFKGSAPEAGQVLLHAEGGILGMPSASFPLHLSDDQRELIAGN